MCSVKRILFSSFRWNIPQVSTNSQAATCHHLFVALGSTHHFPVGASNRTRSQGRTNTGGQPVVVPPKEGLEPKSSLGTLLARFHSRENIFLDIKSYYVLFCFSPLFSSTRHSPGACREREIERFHASIGHCHLYYD